MSDRFTWMHSGQMGAPQMNGAAGSNGQMLQVLDACLTSGFNPQTVMIVTKTATTVTLTFGVSHGYELLQLIVVSGATDNALNGQHRVISKTANTVTIDAADVAVTTGTITTKISPIGFESMFGATDPLKRAYRSSNMQSTRTVLYLDMSLPTGHGYHATNPAKRAMVSMCEDMTALGVQINSYTDIKNNFTANANGSLFWYQARESTKSAAVTSVKNCDWVLVGNDTCFYFFPIWQTYDPELLLNRDLFAFGDMPSLAANDGFNCVWVGSISTNDADTIYWAANGAKVGGDPNSNPTHAGDHSMIGYFIRNVDGSGDLQPIVLTLNGLESIKVHSGGMGLGEPTYPNPSSNSLIAMPLYFMPKKSIRAQAIGLFCVMHNLNNNPIFDLNITDGCLLIMTSQNGYTNAPRGFFAIDLRG